MRYKWKEGSRLKVDADTAGAVCSALADKNQLTARNLLNESRAADAPLHDAFEWDDGAAAEAYREDQARHLIRCLVVVNDEDEQTIKPTRVFFNLGGGEPYRPLPVILQREDDRARLNQRITAELIAIKNKYETVKEFEAVWSAIEEVSG